MPRVVHTIADIEQKDDGDLTGEPETLIDVSVLLSDFYGRLVRQGQVFKCTNFNFTLRQDDNLLNNEVGGAVSGFLQYYEPTKYRKAAWIYAFNQCQKARKAHGTPMSNYDFRVGLHTDYPEVFRQAWVQADQNPLYLAGGVAGQNSIFKTWNANADKKLTIQQPQEMLNFGTPVAFTDTSSSADRDFVINDTAYFKQNNASEQAGNLAFMASFMNRIEDNQTSDTAASAGTTAHSYYAPIHAMCGLIGVKLESSAIDATIANDDVTLDISFDVESWSPIKKPKRRKRGVWRTNSKRKRRSRRRSKR